MKVLHVITGLAEGGAEQTLRDLLRHTRCDAEVVTLTNPGVLAGEIRADGTPVTDLGMRSNTDLAALPRLTRLIRDGRFDVVHTHLYRAGLFGRLAARWAGVRTVVATEHSLGEHLIEGRPTDRAGVRALYLGAERLGRMTVAVSPTVVELLARWGVPRHRITMIPNGIDLASFRFDAAARREVREGLGIAPGARVLGTVGRLAPTKRVDLLVEAVRQLPGVVLLVVGDGPARPELESLAWRLGIGERVIFTGASRDVRGMLSAMDAYASASPGETFGLSVVEALAAGLPSVYVACPALDDLPGRVHLGARKVAADAVALRVAAAAAMAEPDRLAPPDLPGYDIVRTAAQLDELYRALHGAPAELANRSRS
jgi:glycosyltransferase involved in cell wall biosynthesis